ncbi:uncharacterized protein [Anoplolepis gracilipes]|uniref:uncharacterized protein n=1 Tax=Anoplolepis gracilipes TaxID=354296 RepID=UPI003BA186B9
MSGFVSLELQIISINFLSLFGGIWSWFNGNQQLEKISNFSVSNELDVKDIDWLKTVLSWIEVIRFVINRVSLLAYIVNIYTIATRRWQNLLIFWMVLSLLKDIALEVVVVIITFLQWYKGSVSILLFIEFIIEKTVWLVFSTCKWLTILKWYMRLRREAKIRRFTRIAQRSVASIANVPGRIGHSLNDEYLDIATVRRDKYGTSSLLNLNELSKRSSNKINFDLRISKSLTTLITNDYSHDSNNTNHSSTNDLSVTEKSMRMLGLTAEDVMDACARIQERSYWSEENVTTKMSEAMEQVVVQFSLQLEKDEKEMDDDASGSKQKDNVEKIPDSIKNEKKSNDTLKSKQTILDVEKVVDCNLIKEVIIQNSHCQIGIERREEESNNKIVSIDKKEQILIDKKQDVLLTENEDVTSDTVSNRVKSTEFQKLEEDASSKKKKRKEEKERPARIKHCPLSSAQCKNARNMEAKPCASLMKKLETKLRPISTNQKKKWLHQLDRKKYSYRVKLTPTPTSSDVNKEESYKNSRTLLCSCHRALKRNTDTSRNGKYAQSTDINVNKNVKHDIDRKEFKQFGSIVNAQKDKLNGCGSRMAFKYSEAYRLRKQIQKSQGSSSTKQTIAWGSMSLAQTARPSGYTRAIATNKPSRFYQRNVQTEACTESNDSLNAYIRYKSERRIQSRQSTDTRSIHNTSFTEKNYTRSEKREAKTPQAYNYNDLTLLNKKGKARRRHALSPNHKLSSEEREAVELRALKAFNQLTLLEDRKKLEPKIINRNSSLNYKQLTTEFETPEIKVFKSYDDLTSLEKQKEIGAIKEDNNLSLSCKRSIEAIESSALKVCNEYTLLIDKEKLKTEGKHESSKYERLKRYEENVETSTSVSNLHFSEVNHEESRIFSSSIEMRRNARANSSSEQLNEHYAGQAYMSLNLREITRNIEWTIHPRGIILTNKNLQSTYHQFFFENGRFRENQQRDIVDDNIASTLHSAFFFKSEIVTRVFRRVQTRIGESLPSFPSFWREDFNMEFVCRVTNETVVQWDRDSTGSSFDFDVERITASANENNLRNLSFPDVNGNRVAGEDNRELCIIFIDQEQASHESETAIIEDSRMVVGSQENASSVENIETTNILLVCILRDFGSIVEVSEESVRDVTSSVETDQIEEYGDISNVVVNNANFQFSSNFSANETSSEEENNNRRENTVSLRQQILHSNDTCSLSDDVDVTSSVNLLQHDNPDNLSDKKYTAIDASSEKKIHDINLSLKDVDNNAPQLSNSSNNNKFDTLINKSEKSIFNPENALQLSFSDSLSFIKEYNFNQSRSGNEELQKLTQLSDSEITLENQKRELVKNLETTNYDTISQSETVETSNLLKTMARDDSRNEDEGKDVYEKANIFLTHQFSRMNKDERLQDDSFYSIYERNNDSMETLVSLGDGSLMEEFPYSTISPVPAPETSSTKNSAHSQ